MSMVASYSNSGTTTQSLPLLISSRDAGLGSRGQQVKISGHPQKSVYGKPRAGIAVGCGSILSGAGRAVCVYLSLQDGDSRGLLFWPVFLD